MNDYQSLKTAHWVHETFSSKPMETEFIELQSLLGANTAWPLVNSDSESEEVYFEAIEHPKDYVDSSISSLSDDFESHFGRPHRSSAKDTISGLALLVRRRIGRLSARATAIRYAPWKRVDLHDNQKSGE